MPAYGCLFSIRRVMIDGMICPFTQQKASMLFQMFEQITTFH